MSVFHSILHVPLRVEAGEQLSVGLLMLAGNDVFFRYSPHKVQLVKELMAEPRHRLLKQALNGITRTIETEARKIQDYHYQLQESTVRQQRFLREDYIGYLAQYHHNLLTFTSPTPINLPENQTAFLRLYEKFVDQIPAIGVQHNSPFHIEEIVSDKLYPHLKGRVNLGISLTSHDIPTLFLPTRVSFIGRNDAPMVGRVVDFSKRAYNLQHDLAEMYTLVKAFEESGEDNGKYFVIGQEPHKNQHKEHDTWAAIHRSKTVEYVDLAETERITEYANTHNVEPFIQEAD
ncbi:MAG: hypothetical protein NWR72_02970 [Bacteroidia bacterium]|nr:hypothetical protein [Bacteroidia bacterium]